MNFCSENNDRVHPAFLRAVKLADKGFMPAYGRDPVTQKTAQLIQEACGRKDVRVFYCFNGTGANNFALSAVTNPHQSVLCADISHVYNAESTATEAITGCRLYPLSTKNGKIRIKDLKAKLKKGDRLHFPPPAVLTITQPTENGTVYSDQELQAIAACCKKHNLILHVDGARLFHALPPDGTGLKKFIRNSGVDVLTMGGTKAGMLFGEAVLFFGNKEWGQLEMIHKRSMQLASKNRYIAAQFMVLFRNGLWQQLSRHMNGLAALFSKLACETGIVHAAYPVQTNTVFLKLDPAQYQRLSSKLQFHFWDLERHEARLVFSHSHTRNDVKRLVQVFRLAAKQQT